jgi:nicotinamidase-related amidase
MSTNHDTTTRVKRIVPEQCVGILIDVQPFFVKQLSWSRRRTIKTNSANLFRLFRYFKIPLVATLERPVEDKGSLPDEMLTDGWAPYVLEKDFFDLTKEQHIRDLLASLDKKQAIITGCETDVCVLQSCLGLLDLGYQVFVVEDLLFSSTDNVESAIARMRAEGATLLTYKTLCYELLQARMDSPYDQELMRKYGWLPANLRDAE